MEITIGQLQNFRGVETKLGHGVAFGRSRTTGCKMLEIGELLPQKIGAIKQKNVELEDFAVR
jgi:hypothetical protein